MARARFLLTATVALLAATLTALPSAAVPEGPSYPSPAWFQREAQNYATVSEAPRQQVQDPAFLQRWQEQSQANFLTFVQRHADGTWPWDSAGNVCETWGEQCTGDPYRYPGVDPFYADEARVTEVQFFDLGGALLSGRVWVPKDAKPNHRLPGVVIENGSVQAPETLYWWFAQTLVRNGYMVLTFDVRGQGRSDNHAPDGSAGSNANPEVFVTDLVAAVDLLRSRPGDRYTPDLENTRAGADPAPFNPEWRLLDRDRIGIVGHSLGATGASYVQGLDPWPGPLGADNPVDVLVAWDNLGAGAQGIPGYELTPRVPAMGQSADYFLTPQPKTSPPDPEEKKAGGYTRWRAAGLPTYQVNIQGGSHYEWSLLPTFPTSAWEPGGSGGWGNPLARHYTLAWLDRWLKDEGEVGYADADARLLADDDWCSRLSFYTRSARDFRDRAGAEHHTEDLRADCMAATP